MENNEEKTIRQIIYEFMELNPTMKFEGVRSTFAHEMNINTIKKYFHDWKDMRQLKVNLRKFFEIVRSKTKPIKELTPEEMRVVEYLDDFVAN